MTTQTDKIQACEDDAHRTCMFTEAANIVCLVVLAFVVALILTYCIAWRSIG